jgi:hypothetical protein
MPLYFSKIPQDNQRKWLVLLASSGLWLFLVACSLWLDNQIRTAFRDSIAFAQDIYNPLPPPTPPPPPPPGTEYCGDGVCNVGETSAGCPGDCGSESSCPDGVCQASEDCPEDCAGSGGTCYLCSGICCDNQTCAATEMGCWPNLPPGDPGNSSCNSSSDCTISCECPPGYDCELVCGNNGCYSNCSQGGGGGGGCDPTYPDRPTLNSPADAGVAFVSGTNTLTLQWNALGSWGTGCPANANYYAVYVDYNNPPQTQLCWVADGTTSCSIPNDLNHKWLFQPGYTYHWRVVATNGSLLSGSDTWSYTMGGGLSGTVYNDSYVGACSTATTTSSGWSVTCDGQTADKSGADFTCKSGTYSDGSSKTALTQGSHTLALTPPSGWQLSCNPYGSWTVSLNQSTPTVTDYNLMITQAREGWFQAQGGEVHADSGSGGETVKSQIPDTCTVPNGCTPYLSLPDTNTLQSGTVSRASGTRDVGSGSVSSEGWSAQAGSYEGVQADYAFWRQHLSDQFTTQNTKEITSDPGNGFWLATNSGGTLTISSNWNVASGEQLVLLYDGDVQINANQTVADGGSLMIVASGTISFAATVTRADGVYIASTISTGTTGNHNDVAFLGQGAFIGWSSVSLERDLGGTGGTLGQGNRLEPGEKFVYRPDIVFNLPTQTKKPFYTWREKVNP